MSAVDTGSPDVYLHATALVVAEAGVLVRGASGAGKSRLTMRLIAEAQGRGLFARLVGDDRIALDRRGDRLLARGHPAIGGKVELRGEGVVSVPFTADCVIRIVVDLSPVLPARIPSDADGHDTLLGVMLPRIVRPAGLAGVDAAEDLDRIVAATRGRAHPP